MFVSLIYFFLNFTFSLAWIQYRYFTLKLLTWIGERNSKLNKIIKQPTNSNNSQTLKLLLLLLLTKGLNIEHQMVKEFRSLYSLAIIREHHVRCVRRQNQTSRRASQLQKLVTNKLILIAGYTFFLSTNY